MNYSIINKGNKMRSKVAALSTSILALIILTGCSSVPMDDSEVYDEYEPSGVEAKANSFDSKSYEKGVRDVLNDMRGRLAVNNDYVFMPPLKECGVWIPTRTINGVVVPAHETCVVYAPGYYVEKDQLFQVQGIKP
jgi:hypothetical protein